MPVLSKHATVNMYDPRGFTLIEMLIALTILAVSMLALASATITAMQTNQINEVRNGAIQVASQKLAELYQIEFEDIASTPNETRSVRLKGGHDQIYTLNTAITPYFTPPPDLTPTDLIQIAVTVNYTFKGRPYVHNTVTYRRSAD